MIHYGRSGSGVYCSTLKATVMPRLAAYLIGLLTFCGVAAAYLVSADWLQRATGLLGGCGPCGGAFCIIVVLVMWCS